MITTLVAAMAAGGLCTGTTLSDTAIAERWVAAYNANDKAQLQQLAAPDITLNINGESVSLEQFLSWPPAPTEVRSRKSSGGIVRESYVIEMLCPPAMIINPDGTRSPPKCDTKSFKSGRAEYRVNSGCVVALTLDERRR